MKLGKHTLMIDGNYFVYSRLYVMPRSKSGKLLGDEKEKAQFMRKLCIDIASEIRKMRPFIDQVVVAVDSIYCTSILPGIFLCFEKNVFAYGKAKEQGARWCWTGKC